MWNAGAEASPDATWACVLGWLDDFARRHRADRRPDADPARHRRPDPVDRRPGPAPARGAARRPLRRDRRRPARHVRHPRRRGQPRAAGVPRRPDRGRRPERVRHDRRRASGSSSSPPPRTSPRRPRTRRSSTTSVPRAPARCSTTCRPRPSTSCPSTRSGSPCRPRSATSGCGSSGPATRRRSLPVVVYMHGGGWILGNAGTHDRLVRELAVGARAAVAFVEYTPSPEARYPVAIEQGYATAQWITREGAAPRSGRSADGRRRRVGRRQHDRRTRAHGQGAR